MGDRSALRTKAEGFRLGKHDGLPERRKYT